MKILKIKDERSGEIFEIGSETNNGTIVELRENYCRTVDKYNIECNFTYECIRLIA